MEDLRRVNNFYLRKIREFHYLRQKLYEISAVIQPQRKDYLPGKWR